MPVTVFRVVTLINSKPSLVLSAVNALFLHEES